MRGFRDEGHASEAKLVDMDAEIVRETEAAWLLNDGFKQAWVPKSQVEDNGDGTFTMPSWLHEAKGFR